MKNISLQLWSCYADAENDLEGTLRKLKAAGLNGAELFQYPKMPKEQFEELLKELDMSIPSIHIQDADIMENWKSYCEYFVPLGTKYFVMPGRYCHTVEDYERFKAEFSELGKKIRSEGGELLYHNHTPEFTECGCLKDGRPYWFGLAEECSDFGLQLDAYWAKVPGYDPLKLLNDYSDRIKSVHVKNGMGQDESCDIDKGIIDFKPIIAKMEELGIDWNTLEYERDPASVYGFCERASKYINSL